MSIIRKRASGADKLKIQLLPNDKIDPSIIKGGTLFPKAYCNMFLEARTGSGKTTALFNILKHTINKKTKVIFYVSSVFNDDTYKHIVKWLKKKGIPYELHTSLHEGGEDLIDNFFKEAQLSAAEEFERSLEDKDAPKTTQEVVCEIIFPHEEEEEPKDKPPSKKNKLAPKYFFVLDDISDEMKDSRSLARLMKECRHYKAKLAICSQYHNDVPRGARSQLHYIILWPGIDRKKISEAHQNLGLRVPEHVFHALYKDATKEPHNFLFVDILNNRYKKNFDTDYDISELEE